MILRGIDFGPAWIGSSALWFFGEGHWTHRYYSMLFGRRFCPHEFTFVAKTTTVESRLGKKYGEEGNMELNDDFTPKQLLPDCISSKFIAGEMLNAVGLSGPGARKLFERGEWQERTEPFFLSFMTTKKGEEAVSQMREFNGMLWWHMCYFRAPIGLQINLSCPNAGVDLEEAARDACIALDIFAPLGIPLVLKFNVLISVDVVKKITEHPACDAILVSNTIPYGKHASIDWYSDVSPLAQYGGGGLSGAQLLSPVCEWIKLARKAGITKPINAGGGILCSADVDQVKKAGADGISIATAVTLRPWRLRSILERANEVFSTIVEGK